MYQFQNLENSSLLTLDRVFGISDYAIPIH